jgi:TonB family protein
MESVGFVLARVGTEVLGRAPEMIVSTGLVLVAVGAAERLLARRVSAAARLWLYAAVLVRAALPAGFTSPLGLRGGAPGRGAGAVELGGELVMLAPPAAEAVVPLPEAMAGAVYLLVAAGLLAAWLRGRLRLRALVRETRPADAAVAALAPGVAVRVHLEHGPFVAGLLRPAIVVPERLVRGDRGALACVLAHERAHVERRDHLSMPVVQLACLLAWPVLPLWLAARRLRTLVEMACDERAVAGRAADERRTYAEVLLALAQGRPPLRGYALAPSFGSELRARVAALRWCRRWGRAAQATVVAAVAAVGVACSGEAPREELAAREAASPAARNAPLVTVTKDGRYFVDKLEVTRDTLEAALRERVAKRDSPLVLGKDPKDGVPVVLYQIDEAQPQSTTTAVVESVRRAGARAHNYLGQGLPGPANSLTGELDLKLVAKAVRGQMPAVKRCYETALQANPGLAGKLVVRFTVDVDGAVRRASLDQDTLAAPEVGRCVLDVLKAVEFPPPTGGSVEVSYPFVFEASDSTKPKRDPVLTINRHHEIFLFNQKVAPEDLEEKLRAALHEAGSDTVLLRADMNVVMKTAVDVMATAKRAAAKNIALLKDEERGERFGVAPSGAGSAGGQSPPPGRPSDVIPGQANVAGSLDKEIIRRVIRRHINDVKACYERELAGQPDLGGRIEVEFTIGGTGQVVASTLADSTMGNRQVEACVVKAVREWEFPKPLGGGIVVVKYPFNFTPGKAASTAPPAPQVSGAGSTQ